MWLQVLDHLQDFLVVKGLDLAKEVTSTENALAYIKILFVLHLLQVVSIDLQSWWVLNAKLADSLDEVCLRLHSCFACVECHHA